MQNVVNSMTPFFDPTDGKPLSAGRVTFVELNTDNVTRLIDIVNVDGVPMANPLALDDSGRFVFQPFAPDGVDFKMIVEKLVSAEPVQFQQVGIVYQKHGSAFTADLHGAPVVDDLSELRLLSPDFGKAIVLGYGSAGDFCPPRIFQWKEDDIAENYGTHVRSSVEGYENAGCWICEPEDSVDVRWFGINPASDHVDCLERLGYIKASYPYRTVFFTSGNYFLSDDVALYSVKADQARFNTTGAKNVVFTIDRFDGKGALFLAVDTQDSGSFRVIPKLKGIFYTSMCSGTINEFMTDSAMADVNVVVFDNGTLREGSAAREFQKKLVIVEGHDVPSSIRFVDSVKVDLKNKSTKVMNFYVGDNVAMVNGTYDDDERSDDPIPKLSVYFGMAEIMRLDPYDRLKIFIENVERSHVDHAFLKHVNYKCSGNRFYVESINASEVDLTDISTADSLGRSSYGDIAVVRGSIKIIEDPPSYEIAKVIINRDDYYRPDPFYDYVELGKDHALMFHCVGNYNPYAHGGPKPAMWIPFSHDIVINHVTPEPEE